MGRKKNKSKKKHLAVASEENEPSEPSSSNQLQTEPSSVSPEHRSERDNSMILHLDVTQSTPLKGAENAAKDWKNDIDDFSEANWLLQWNSKVRNRDPTMEAISRIFQEPSSPRQAVASKKPVQRSNNIWRVREYWNALNNEEKRRLLEVSVEDLRAHFAERRDKLEMLAKAVSFAERNKTWASWVCSCDDEFADPESHKRHMWSHIGDLSPGASLFFPKKVDESWAEMIVDGSWKPFDRLAVIKILDDSQRDSQSAQKVDSLDIGFHVEGSNNDNFSGTSVGAVNVDLDVGTVDNEGNVDSDKGNHNSESDLADGDEKKDGLGPMTTEWPVSHDPERSKLLEKIRSGLLLLLKCQYLTEFNMAMMINTALNRLRTLAPAFKPFAHALEKSHACICLLDAPDIINLLESLEVLLASCGLTLDSKIPSDKDGPCRANVPLTDVPQEIELSDDLSHLILKKFLPTFGEISTAENDIQVDCSPDPVLPKDGLVGVDDFVSWINMTFTGELESLICLKNETKSKIFRILKTSKTVFDQMQNLLMDRRRDLLFVNALVATETRCIDYCRATSRGRDTEYTEPNLEYFLRSRQEELAQKNSIFEKDAIELVFDEAKAWNGTLSADHKKSPLSDWISSLNENSRIQDSKHLSIASIVFGIQEQKFKCSNGVSIIDVKVRQIISILQKLKHMLTVSSAFDYQEIIFFLLKTFLQEHLEVLAFKQAEMKSDAVSKALLAELELEEKNKPKKGQNNSKQIKEKPNKSKKKKDRRKSKHMEAGLKVDNSPVTLEESEIAGSSSLEAPFPRAIQNFDLTSGSCSDVLQPLNVDPAPADQHHGDSKIKTLEAIEESGDEEDLEQSGDEEQDDEFQSDLQKAVQESLDSYKAEKEKRSAQSSNDGRDSHEIVIASTEGRRNDAVRTGMKNDDDYDCFIAVIMKSLWCIRWFREEFSRMSKALHQHVGDPCVVCGLHDIFTGLVLASTETQRKAVSQNIKTWSRRFHAIVQSFQVEPINDAAKVLNTILNCLHQSFTSRSDFSAIVSKENDISSCDCSSEYCIAHQLFGTDITERITCLSCTKESRRRKYSSFVHVVEATALQKMQTTSSDRSLVKLLKHVKMNKCHICRPEGGGCGKRNYILHIRAINPHVFTAVLTQNMLESADDMSDVHAELDIDAVPCGLEYGKRYYLISMICYNEQLYSCFAYSIELGLWVLYGDATVEAIGGWGDLLEMIKRESLQPLVLFYESVIRY